MTTTENVVLTAETFYEGSPVSYQTIMRAAGCTADDITTAVKAGLLRFVRKVAGAHGCRKGIAQAFVVPNWAK